MAKAKKGTAVCSSVCAERVNQIVNESGMTQKEFAEKVVHCTQQHMSRLMRGDSPVTAETAVLISNYFTNICTEWILGKTDIKDREDYAVQCKFETMFERAEAREIEWQKILHSSNYADRQIKALELILYNQGLSLELNEKNEYIIFETNNRDSVLANFTHSEIDQLLKRMARQTMFEITWLDEDKRKERKVHENMKYFFNQEEHNG